MTDQWLKYQGTLLWSGSPHETPPTQEEALTALKKHGGMFARWTSDWDCGSQTQWWYCICDHYTPIEELTAKQRYRVNKGLRLCRVVPAPSDPEQICDAVYDLVKASFEDYPEAYRPKLPKDAFINHLKQLSANPDIDLWLVYSNENENELVGYCQCTKKQDVVWLTQVKVPTAYLNMEVNAMLIYQLCAYYLNENHYKYICDGERNIKHMTNYQDYLVRVLNFRFAYCTLNIVYPWWMRMIINTLYPFRNAIKRMADIHPLAYNIYCVLYQEQIHRTFTKKQV